MSEKNIQENKKNPKSFKVHPIDRVVSEISKYVVGREEELWLLCITTLCNGHALLQGPPGTGKTLLASNLTKALGGVFKRIQMTSDLLPADIIGTTVYNIGTGTWSVRKGPIFTDVLLLDELNRATPRTQSAMLEAMQEKQVTIEGVTYPLPKTFIAIATQVPSGGEGTYPLTDVQIDRFAFNFDLKLPSAEEEIEIMSRIDLNENSSSEAVTSPDELIKLYYDVKNIEVSKSVKRYIVDIVDCTRKQSEIRTPPGTRTSIWMYKGARALAFLEGRDYVLPDDVKAIAPYALKHRIRIKPEAYAEGQTTETIIQKALEITRVPKE